MSSAVAVATDKRCPHCKTTKPRDAFNKNKARPDGLQDRCRDCRKSMYWQDADAARQSVNEWRRKNPEKAEAGVKRWISANRDRLRARTTAAARERRKDPAYRLKQAIASSMCRVLKGRDASSKLEAAGYTAAELRAHLERQFTKGMGWDNYGEWHLDHIVPLSSFQIHSTEDPDFKRAWALTNLRPLWAQENISKGARREFLL